MTSLFDDDFEPDVQVTLTAAAAPQRPRFGAARKPFRSYAGEPLQVWHDCTVTWTEWSGCVTNPYPNPHRATGVTVTHRGHQTLELSGGTLRQPIRRKLGSHGFTVSHARRIIIDETTTLGRDKRIH